MAVTYGFYNSLNGDRKYNVRDWGTVLDGIINDGVFMSIGTAFMVTSAGGFTINVGVGRAWFNRTWTYNDSVLPLVIDPPEVVLNRIDTVVLDINENDDFRTNEIKIVKGEPATDAQKPNLIRGEYHNQYALCHVYVGKNVSSIAPKDITNVVGTGDTPFVTGPLETLDVESLLIQWEDEFNTWNNDKKQEFLNWFSTIDDILDENAATNLASMITQLETDYFSFKNDTNQTIEDIEKEIEDIEKEIEDIEKEIDNYSSYASDKDDNGVFTTVEYRDINDILHMTSSMSNPDTDGNYQTVTWTFTDSRPNRIIDLTYDEDGDIVSKVLRQL